MSIRLQLFIVAIISILTVGLVFLDVPLIGPVISLIGMFVLPGWLLTDVLFGIRDGPTQETRFILIFGLGALFVAFELFIMSLIGVRISRESVALVGAASSFLLIGIFILRFRTMRSDFGNISVPRALALSAVTVLVLYGFVLLHQFDVKENYTEFYVVPRAFGTDDQISKADLVIFSHEQKEHLYAVLCTDATDSTMLLAQSSLEPESSLTVELFVPPPQPGSTSKIRLSLYREGDATPYRWVELTGEVCNLLP